MYLIDTKLKNDCYSEKGYILEPNQTSKYKHIFGGDSWHSFDKKPLEDKAILLFVLSLEDPKLSFLRVNGLEEIPIFSYINSDLWYEPQIYKINTENKSVLFIHKKDSIEFMQLNEDKIPNPIPPKNIVLRDMKSSEYSNDEDSYWRITDDFLGGDSFLRVLGKPLWIEDRLDVKCSCSKCMYFVMSIGYEGWGKEPRWLPNQIVFFGECALYVFFCKNCLEIKIISQYS